MQIQAQREDQVEIQDTHLQAKDRGSEETNPAHALISDFQRLSHESVVPC